MTCGITNGARYAELLFIQLTGAVRLNNEILLDGNVVEIRLCTRSTINQLRPLRYETVAVFHAKTESWYVIPPHDVVKLSLRKAKGQHSSCPLESFSTSLTSISSFHTKTSELRVVCGRAAQYSRCLPRVIEGVKSVKTEHERLAKKSLELFRQILDVDDLGSQRTTARKQKAS